MDRAFRVKLVVIRQWYGSVNTTIHILRPNYLSNPNIYWGRGFTLRALTRNFSNYASRKRIGKCNFNQEWTVLLQNCTGIRFPVAFQGKSGSIGELPPNQVTIRRRCSHHIHDISIFFKETGLTIITIIPVRNHSNLYGKLLSEMSSSLAFSNAQT